MSAFKQRTLLAEIELGNEGITEEVKAYVRHSVTGKSICGTRSKVENENGKLYYRVYDFYKVSNLSIPEVFCHIVRKLGTTIFGKRYTVRVFTFPIVPHYNTLIVYRATDIN